MSVSDADSFGRTAFTSRKPFDFEGLVSRLLSDDDRVDMDEELTIGMANAAGATGAIVMPPAESVQRVRDPLSEETKNSFGDFIMRAFKRTDLDDDAD
ncbi:hypothetical protein [Lentzea jiangxiensis]|uniref:Uncharacterized protein n=1 Tax=Lentzea jiangxiensis TaxID=641025 RepID=A0A1H0WHC0_9PSEU|nr:hypothetical protein [Lentzea jiangxiensis]SDP90179.1 hypothetical protein SAMN05421507_119123 [Lentzea jiangxiensis]